MKDKFIGQCSQIKGILMVLVVLYHCCVFWTGKWWSEPPITESIMLNIVSRYLNSFHVYGFTLVSGYIFSYKVIMGGI